MGNAFIFDAAINDEIFTVDDMISKPQSNIYVNEFEQVTAESEYRWRNFLQSLTPLPLPHI